MVVLPLIIFSIISGVSSLDSKTTGRLGGYAVAYYAVTTVLAVIWGIVLRFEVCFTVVREKWDTKNLICLIKIYIFYF